MAETLLPRDEAGISTWTSLPCGALTGIPSGGVSLSLPLNLLPVKVSQPLGSSHLCPGGFLEELAGLGPRNHTYDLEWSEEGLPLQHQWLGSPEDRYEEWVGAGQGQASPSSSSPRPQPQLGLAAPLNPLDQSDLLWRVHRDTEASAVLEAISPVREDRFPVCLQPGGLRCVSRCPASPWGFWEGVS